jgi:DNA invertase Pin-like site-specific DNA recombinase
MKRAGIHVRISTNEQNPDLQHHELPEYCRHRGWQVAEVYEDRISGGKHRRAGLDRLMSDAKRRKFDVVGGLEVRQVCPFNESSVARPGGILGAGH